MLGTRTAFTGQQSPKADDDGDRARGNFAEKIWNGMKRIPHHWTHDSAMPVLFGLGMLTIFMCAIVDFRTHSRADPESDLQARPQPSQGTSMGPRSLSVDSMGGSERPP